MTNRIHNSASVSTDRKFQQLTSLLLQDKNLFEINLRIKDFNLQRVGPDMLHEQSSTCEKKKQLQKEGITSITYMMILH